MVLCALFTFLLSFHLIATWELVIPAGRDVAGPRTSPWTGSTGSASSPSIRRSFGSPSFTPIDSTNQHYIILFNSTSANLTDVLSRVNLTSEHPDVHHIYGSLSGFCATLSSHGVETLTTMPDVLVIEGSQPVTTASASGIRTGSPWGLQRISSSAPPQGNISELYFTYQFDASNPLGRGVDIYVIDTGINTDQIAFNHSAVNVYPPSNPGFNPASPSFSNPDAPTDDDGHGTHVAGTAGAMVFGVAPATNIFGLKVLNSTGQGSSATVMAGIDYALQMHNSRKALPSHVGSIINLSLNISPPPGITLASLHIATAISSATAAGIHVVGAAGNDASNACENSPGNAGGTQGPAVIVGATTSFDEIAYFSNVGDCVDVYAPGLEVVSTYAGADNAIAILSGTSQASPHVAGLMAYLMSANATLAQDPGEMKRYLRQTALGGKLKVSGETMSEPALLVNNGILQ
jgi:cerevisin